MKTHISSLDGVMSMFSTLIRLRVKILEFGHSDKVKGDISFDLVKED